MKLPSCPVCRIIFYPGGWGGGGGGATWFQLCLDMKVKDMGPVSASSE